MLKTMRSGALLVATSLLNTYTKFFLNFLKFSSKSDKNRPIDEQNAICPYLDIRNKYYRFWPINWVNFNIFE